MTEMEHLDVRTVTLGLSLLDCSSDSIATIAQKAGDKIRTTAARLVKTVDEIGDEFGIRVANKRISVTPVSLLTEGAKGDPVQLARAIDDAARDVGVDFLGGYSALVQKGTTESERRFRFYSGGVGDDAAFVLFDQCGDDARGNQHGRRGPGRKNHQGSC